MEWMLAYKNNVSLRTINDVDRYRNLAGAGIGDRRLRDITAANSKRLYQTQKGKRKPNIHKYTGGCVFVSAEYITINAV